MYIFNLIHSGFEQTASGCDWRMGESVAHRFTEGDLCVDEEGFVGFVRYVGPVEGSKRKNTIYAGVEWRDSARGRHDGKGLFSCAHPTSGSFVKVTLLRKCVSFKDAILSRYEGDDIRGAEEHSSDETNAPGGPQRKNGKLVEIQKVGMEQIRSKQKIHMLREVSLSDSALISAGEPGWVKENCPSIKELELSDNLIDSWEVVGEIASQLNELEHLSLARNSITKGIPINPLERLPASIKEPMTSLRVLVLNRTRVNFSEIQRLEDEGALPLLEDLVLGDNDLTSLDPLANVKSEFVSHARGSYAAWAQEQLKQIDRKGFTPESFARGFPNLKKIDISRNRLRSWSEVWRLSRLPALRHVNVSDNPIEEIFFDKPVDGSAFIEKTERKEEEKKAGDQTGSAATEKKARRFVEELDIVMSNGMVVPIAANREPSRYTEARLFKGDGTGGGAQPFRNLETILLCRTRVVNWKSIDALNKFPSLTELRLQGSPIIATVANAGAARQTTIARIKSLLRLNGSEISPRERTDAERLYLKRLAMEMTKLGSDTEREILKEENPRFNELVNTHGDPMEAARRAKVAQESSGSLAANSASLTIRSFDPQTCTVPPVKKKLPLSMTVKELKIVCQRLFKVEADFQKLFYRETGKDFGHPVALDEEDMPLSDFGVSAGGEIILEARDLEKEKQDESKKAAKDAALMKAQEEHANLQSRLKREEVEQAKLQ